MVHFSREELLHLAELSALQLDDVEVKELERQLQITLEYVEQLDEVVVGVEQEALRSINVFRDDKVVEFNSDLLLEQAPQVEDNCFVVPKILDR